MYFQLLFSAQLGYDYAPSLKDHGFYQVLGFIQPEGVLNFDIALGAADMRRCKSGMSGGVLVKINDFVGGAHFRA